MLRPMLLCLHTPRVVWSPYGIPVESLWPRLLMCSYKRVKGRSHTVETRISMHPHKPHATDVQCTHFKLWHGA